MRSVAFDRSSNLLALTYEEGASERPSVCDVWFVGGNSYRFFGVEAEKIDAWERSESAGKYFHANIRGKYSSVKLECVECKTKGSDLVIVQRDDRLSAYCQTCYERLGSGVAQ